MICILIVINIAYYLTIKAQEIQIAKYTHSKCIEMSEIDPVSSDPVSLDPVPLNPVSLNSVSLDPVSSDFVSQMSVIVQNPNLYVPASNISPCLSSDLSTVSTSSNLHTVSVSVHTPPPSTEELSLNNKNKKINLLVCSSYKKMLV